MIGRKDLLKNLQSGGPYFICLPNGSEVIAIEQGGVYLGPNFNVRNVLFIPELKCNLIFLGQLMEDTNRFIFV